MLYVHVYNKTVNVMWHMLYNICYITSNWRLYNQRGFCYVASCLLSNKKFCYIAHPNLPDAPLTLQLASGEARAPNMSTGEGHGCRVHGRWRPTRNDSCTDFIQALARRPCSRRRQHTATASGFRAAATAACPPLCSASACCRLWNCMDWEPIRLLVTWN